MNLLWAVLSAASLVSGSEVVVARVGAREITRGALEERFEAYRNAGAPVSARNALEDLVDDALLAAEAERQGLALDPAVVAEVERERRRLAAQRLLEREILPAASVDEASLRRLFHMGADTARLRLLVYASQAEAGAAAERLRGAPDFPREAPRAVNGASAPGGELGVRARGQLDPSLAEAAFAAPIGAVLGPMKLELGWGVAQVQDRRVGDEAEFQAKRDSLRAFAEAQARALVKDHYLRRLREAARIQIDQAFLDGLGTRTEPTAQEAAHVLATVAGRPLRYADIVPQVERLSRGKMGGHLSGPRVKAEIASAEVDRLLLEEEAVRRGRAADPAVEAAVGRYRQMALGRALSAATRRKARPSEQDARAWYRDHQAELLEPATRSCSHVLLDDRRQAEAARARLDRGDSFGEVARAMSRDASTAASGGRMGDLTDAQLEIMSREQGEVELARAIREAKPGEVAGPVHSALGWHVLRCEGPSAQRPVPFEEARPAILARLSAQQGDAAVRDRIASLRAGTTIAVDRRAFDAAAARLEAAVGPPPKKEAP